MTLSAVLLRFRRTRENEVATSARTMPTSGYKFDWQERMTHIWLKLDGVLRALDRKGRKCLSARTCSLSILRPSHLWRSVRPIGCRNYEYVDGFRRALEQWNEVNRRFR